jgi:hypothetical protein
VTDRTFTLDEKARVLADASASSSANLLARRRH